MYRYVCVCINVDILNVFGGFCVFVGGWVELFEVVIYPTIKATKQSPYGGRADEKKRVVLNKVRIFGCFPHVQ